MVWVSSCSGATGSGMVSMAASSASRAAASASVSASGVSPPQPVVRANAATRARIASSVSVLREVQTFIVPIAPWVGRTRLPRGPGGGDVRLVAERQLADVTFDDVHHVKLEGPRAVRGEHHVASVRRPARVLAIAPARIGEQATLLAGGPQQHQLREVALPRGIDDPLTVGRPASRIVVA